MRGAKYLCGFLALTGSALLSVLGQFDPATLLAVWGFLMIYLADGEPPEPPLRLA